MLKEQYFNCWQYKIQESNIDEILFTDHGEAFRSSSSFVYMIFVDEQKDIFKCGWSMYHEYKYLLGFLEHVFLTTAYFNWFDRQPDGFYIPVSEFDR